MWDVRAPRDRGTIVGASGSEAGGGPLRRGCGAEREEGIEMAVAGVEQRRTFIACPFRVGREGAARSRHDRRGVRERGW
ncbi:hypothetical protein CTI14_64855, partial [Methylobacterium radiotolerans]